MNNVGINVKINIYKKHTIGGKESMSITKFGKKLLCFITMFAFVFVLFACQTGTTNSDKDEKRAEAKEKVQTALKRILWDPSATKDITDDLVLDTEVAGVKVTWTSSVPDVIATSGAVNQPSPSHEKAEAVLVSGTEEVDYYHVPVELVARASLEYTYTLNDVEKTQVYSETKTFNFTVLCFDGDFGTIAEVKANAYNYIYEEQGVAKALSSNNTVTYSVGFYGVVTAKLNASGAGQFMVHDGTAGIYVYKSADVEVGDTVYVTGDIYSYYGSLQVGSNIAVKVVEDREIEVPNYTEKTIDAWEQERAGENLQNVIGYLGGDRYKLYAQVVAEKNSTTSDEYKIVDPYTGETAWIYYKSYNEEQGELLASYVNKYVYITGVTYDRDSRILKNHLLWDGGIEEAEAPVLTDAQKLDIVKKEVEALAGSYASYSKLALPTENEKTGAVISWNIPSDAPYKDGAFLGVDEDTKTTFVATIKVGEEEAEVEVAITVKKLNVVTIDEAVKLEKGDVVKLSGTVDVLFSSYKNYYLKDATGNILVYVSTKNGIKVNGETKTVKAGDKVEFIGTIGNFNGTPQIASIIKYTSYEEAEWSMSVPTETTIKDLCAATINDAPYGQYVMVSGVVISSKSSDGKTTYYYLAESTAEDAKKISLYYSDVPEKVTAVADTDTKVTLFVYYYGNAKSDYSGDVRVIFNGRNGEYFVGKEEVVLPEPSVDTIITELKEGVAYNFALIQKNLENKKLYLTGEMSGYYLATTEHGYEAVKLYVEKVEGGYYIYFLNGETKTYISLIYRDNSGKDSNSIVVSTDTPSTVWTWNESLSTLVTTIPNQAKEGSTTYYLGAYNTFATISASNVSYASTSFVGHFYPASKEVAPEPTPDPEPDPEPTPDPVITELEENKAYNFMVVQGNVSNKKLYLTGEKSGNFLATTEKVSEAAKLYVEKNTEIYADGYYLYFLKGETKQYIYLEYYYNSNKGTHASTIKIGDQPTTVWQWNTEYNTLSCSIVSSDGTDTSVYYLGTYGTYTTFSSSNITYASTSFVAHFYAASTEVTPDPEPTPDPSGETKVVFTWAKDMGTIADNNLTIEGDDFTITLSKNTSTSDVVNTYDQFRIYKGHLLTITAKNGKKISKIEFTDIHNKNATLTVSESGVTISSEGKVWTITAEKGVDSVSISDDNQWRVSSITITFAE